MDYRIKRREPLYQGFFTLEALTIEHARFDGGRMRVRREHFERGDAAAVLLFDPARDEVLLLEQFRVGPVARGEHPWLIEIVAGIIDPGETPHQAAMREAREEAGYEPRRLKPLGRFYASPGASSERLFLFLGEVARGEAVGAGGGVRQECEDIRLFWVSRREAVRMVCDGRIASAAPMIAIMRAFGTLPVYDASG
ncbi:MAG: NUDIX domain-containing protein [Zetaproteobacteria bacterium]|nr:MAG: NUDIX domain-containing protein [Zetaproteobacteria bacterium]